MTQDETIGISDLPKVTQLMSVKCLSEIINIWRTMGVERTISPKVVQGLLLKLHERPSVNEFTNTNDTNLYVDSLAAMNALCEIQYCREHPEAMQFLYPQLLLGLLTQVHYMFELGLTDPPKTNETSQEAEPMSSPLRCRIVMNNFRSTSQRPSNISAVPRKASEFQLPCF
ncbi:maestro heat-like repeat family member 5 [Notamacropus eugenii]|uniref:maestro heat-like repeat family member 5 n=1 Tax=Notamacropus eugenii TaxID=9315 RepID=UPI003B676709